MNKIISIGQAAKILGVHVQTLRNWEKSGKLKPDSISSGRTRRYNLEHILQLSGKEIPEQISWQFSPFNAPLFSLKKFS